MWFALSRVLKEPGESRSRVPVQVHTTSGLAPEHLGANSFHAGTCSLLDTGRSCLFCFNFPLIGRGSVIIFANFDSSS